MSFSTALTRFFAGSFMLFLICSALPILAQPIDQPGWVESKQEAELPNGMTLAYVETGDPKGSPVVLLHGWTDSSRSWTIVAPHLMKHRLLIPDFAATADRPSPTAATRSPISRTTWFSSWTRRASAARRSSATRSAAWSASGSPPIIRRASRSSF